MTPPPQGPDRNGDGDSADWLVRWADRCEFNETVAQELVRVQSLTVARTSLLRVLELDAKTGRWRLIGNRITPMDFFQILGRLVDAEEEAERREWHENPVTRRGGMCRPREDTRTRLLGVPHATLESWIRNELRPGGYLTPSTGPGRPRRDAPKYELGRHFDQG